ncbi:hypothetical protein [Corynebacterium coyleae]|uniref:hypothetical protein n=1 Tax=Corynebacterium coyleae TaxID=53374 RepID=UPI00254FE5DE|nr:hypothetical protein [Corynebacterium coyleae]MDK8241692.1 hypothetical protein [Corynebacterium coyleae]
MSRHDGKVWVRKLRSRYSTHPWEVRVRDHGGYDYYETFFTWREALDYADRLARTREVVLPRFTALPTSRHIVHKNGLIIEWEQNPDFPSLPPKYLTVKPEERRPLAGVLLALAEQEEA